MQGILKNFGEYMESYRSGHNGAHSKCVCPPGHEGSNPSVSAVKPEFLFRFFYS